MKRYYNGQIYYIKGPNDHKILKLIITVITILVILGTGLFVLHDKSYNGKKDDKFSENNGKSSTEKIEISTIDHDTTTEFSDDMKTVEENPYSTDLRYKKGLSHKSGDMWSAPENCSSLREFVKITEEYIMSGNQEKLVIHTNEMTGEDINGVNKLLTQPFAYVSSTTYRENDDGGADVDVELTYDDSFYVYRYIVYGIAIPADNSKAEKIYSALCDMFYDQDISSMSDYEKELFYHDYITALAEYDEDAVNSDVRTDAHSVYGLLVNHRCVCEGYARTMGLLLSISGIDNYYVSGTTTKPSFFGNGGHAWNIVSIDGKWYHVDATWDDPLGEHFTDEYHTYFNVSDNVMSESRTWDESLYPYCDSMDVNYFKVSDLYFDSYDQYMAYAETELAKNNGKGTVVAAVADYDTGMYDVAKIHKQLYPQSYMTYNIDEVSSGYTIISLQY